MRDPEVTRQKLLTVAAAEFHAKGFKATGLQAILSAADISRGALYHHFANKQELGYAVMEEIYMPMFAQPWQQAFEHEDPLAGMCQFVRMLPTMISDDEMIKGCPLTNMCSEMAAVDEGFRERSNRLMCKLTEDIAKAMARSDLREDVDPMRSAMFMLSSINGMISMVKASRDRQIFELLSLELVDYLNGLRSPASRARAENVDVPDIEFVGCAEKIQEILGKQG